MRRRKYRSKYRDNGNSHFSILTFTYGLIVAVIFVAFNISIWYIQSGVLDIIFLILGFAVIIFLDDGGIRDGLFDLFGLFKGHTWKVSKYDQLSELFKTLSYIGLLLTWLFPYIRVVTLVIVILFPLLGEIRDFGYCGRGCFGLDNNYLSPSAQALLMNGLFMSVWTISNQQYNYLIWLETGLFAVIWIILFFIFNKEYKHNFIVAFSFIVCITVFSFGAIGNVNRVYDFNPIQQYNDIVLNKNIKSSVKSCTFYITVTPSSEENESQKIEVAFRTYKDVKVGQKVTIKIYKGALGFNWFDVVL